MGTLRLGSSVVVPSVMIPSGSANIQSLSITPTTSQQTITATAGVDGYSPITVSAVDDTIDSNIVAGNIKSGVTILGVNGSVVELDGEQINITPTTSQQVITPTSPKNAITQATVSAVTSSIDANITAGNIKKDVTILGVTGNVVELNGQTKSESLTSTGSTTITPDSGYNALTSITVEPTNYTYSPVTPTTSQTVLSIPSNYSGLNAVTVNPVTSSIDANIVAGNIKKNVEILGVTGSYEGITPTGTLSISQNGTYDVTNYATADVTVSGGTGYTEIPDYQVTDRSVDMGNQLFAGDLNRRQLVLSGNEFANITNAQSYALQYAFYRCYISGILTFPNLKRTSISSFQYAFYATQITNANFPALEIINGSQSFSNCFQADNYLNTVTFPSLHKINGTQALYRSLGAATTSVTLPSLSKLNASKTLSEAFWSNTNITSISFPALNTDSFESYTDHFYRMLYSVTGCTVHFPSNIQSTIGSWSDVTSGFGGTNTTVLFDLPATNHLIGANTIEYERNPKDDTQTALAWRKAEYDSAYGLVVDWTSYYTSGTSNPQVNDTIYADLNCTIPETTISSIAS